MSKDKLVERAKLRAWKECPALEFSVPMVCHANWNASDWIEYIQWDRPINRALLNLYIELERHKEEC